MICWTDSLEIAISLADNFPEIDPKTINFVDLRALVLNLKILKKLIVNVVKGF